MSSLPIESLSVATPARDFVSPLRRASAILHRLLNGIVALAVAAQFYTIGLVMFGVTGLGAHRSIGSLTLMVGLLSVLAAFFAGRSHARPLAALGLFGVLLLQPALAFGLRRIAPAFAALHAINGLVALALAVSIELRRQRR